jgi:hypothetical protein
MKSLIPFILILTSCANVSTTKFIYRDAMGASLTVEMPKEMEARKLVVDINAKEGRAIIKADAIQTLNVQTIKAQARRESSIAKSVTEGAASGVIEGASKAIMP